MFKSRARNDLRHVSTWLILLFTHGCEPTIVDLSDKDSDGIKLDADCDDHDPEIGSRFADTDGDGHGAGDPLAGCDQQGIDGYTGIGDDCDDSDETAYPGATEACDGVDHDCDGQVSEEAEYFADHDGDGYGQTSSGAFYCSAPAGHVTVPGDCDDADMSIHSGAEESWTCNQKDDNCNGVVDDDTVLDAYDTDCDDRIGVVTPITGQCGDGPGYAGDGGEATLALLSKVRGLAVDPLGESLFIADSEDNSMIRSVRLSAPATIRRVAGSPDPSPATGDGDFSFATDAALNQPRGIAVDGAGNVYIADTRNHRIRVVNPSGVILPVAGTGEPGATDGGIQDATFNHPAGLALDELRSILYVADWYNSLIRAVDLSGDSAVVSTIAGGKSSDPEAGATPVPAQSVALNQPEGVAVDPVRNVLYIADSGNFRILRLDLADDTMTLLAGKTGIRGNGLGSGQALEATFENPIGVAIAPGFEFLYILDNGNARILLVDQNDGTIRLAGGSAPGGEECTWQSGQSALKTELTYPGAMAVDPGGLVYVADTEKFWVLAMAP